VGISRRSELFRRDRVGPPAIKGQWDMSMQTGAA
jgi:hypothetical protein